MRPRWSPHRREATQGALEETGFGVMETRALFGSCTECFLLVPQYVDLEIAGEAADARHRQLICVIPPRARLSLPQLP